MTLPQTKADEKLAAFGAMLDAAEEVILRDGIGAFTLDAVARQANLSKGGLLHHFPSKEALIDAIVHRVVGEWRCQSATSIESQPAGPGRVPRAVLDNCLSGCGGWNETLRRRGLALVAALVHAQKHVEPIREVHADLARLVAQDGLPAGVGEVVLLVSDGLWFNWIFGINEPSPEAIGAIRTVLRRLVDEASAKPPREP